MVEDEPQKIPPEMPSVELPETELVAKPWGFWLTIVFSICIGLGFIIAQTVICVIFLVVEMSGNSQLDVPVYMEKLQTYGYFWSTTVTAGAVPLILLSMLFAYVKRGISVSEYLGFKKINSSKSFKWVLCIIAFSLLTDGVSYLAGREIVPKVVVDAYNTAFFLPFLLLAIIVIAPISEEIFFRGFLFKGLQDSKLGIWGAIMITSLIWAAIHVQYDIYGICVIFLVGILMGVAKQKTGSLFTTIQMHAAMNLLATMQVILFY